MSMSDHVRSNHSRQRHSLTPTTGGGGGTSVGRDEPGPHPHVYREYWSSRMAFYFATSGAAIGFGNVWRFPGLCVRYGGGAFLIPYFAALFWIGIPLMILEIGFGQYFQTSDIGVFGAFHPRMKGKGVCSLMCLTIITSYYAVLIGWVVHSFVASFTDEDAPWSDPNLTGATATTYFYDHIIGEDTVHHVHKEPTRVVARNVAYTLLVWIIIYGMTAFGLRMTGRITYLTMGLPLLMLVVFLGKAVTLEGASDGVVAYIGIWDFSVLKNREVWPLACSQVFFSTSLTFGIMTAYGSHCKRDEPVVVNSCVIVFANSLFSVLAGFAVFCALGHLARLEGVAVTDLPYDGYGLLFGTWPVVFAKLPGGIHWVRLLFVNLFFLGIDSAVASVETAVTMMQDTQYFQNTARRTLVIYYIVPTFCMGLLYCTDAGLFFLDVIDFYVNFVMLLVGFFETFGVAWAYGIDESFQTIGVKATLSYMLGANFIPTFGAIYCWTRKDWAPWIGFVESIVGWQIGFWITHYFLVQRMKEQPGRWTLQSIWYECAFGHMSRLRDQIQPVMGNIPFVWLIVTRNLIPHLCLVMFSELLFAPNGAGYYNDYAIRPYQLLGLLSFIFAIFLFFIGVLVPEVYESLSQPHTKVILSRNSESYRETEKNLADDNDIGASSDSEMRSLPSMERNSSHKKMRKRTSR